MASNDRIDERAAPLIIRRVDPIPLVLPLKKPMLMGGGQRFDRAQTLIVRIEAANGLVGWGEALSAAPQPRRPAPGAGSSAW